MLYIKKDIINQLIEWTLDERPNEAAGYLFKENTLFKKIVTGNHSIGHFIDENPEQLLKWIKEFGKPNIFHSHPCKAVPSSTDLIYMQTTIPFWGCIWLIMSNTLVLRAWDLTDNGFGVKEIKVVII